MATTPAHPADDKESITPYSMHVSARYLELTQKKLELTRLPRELDLPESRRWEQGTPKSVLEPLLDFWLDGYDWRAAEASFNSSLPQFRTTIALASPSNPSSTESLRIHFVHKRSKDPDAIPLLLCHTWPSSFIEVQGIIDMLTDPLSLPGHNGGTQAFHVVAPSIPGFGFSDASMSAEFGLEGTAHVFDGLMGRLGYHGYVTSGTGWGFSICRALAVYHPTHCHAVHTSNPSFTAPAFKRNKGGYLKYRIARLTKAKIPLLRFGYTPSELCALRSTQSTRDVDDALQLIQPLGSTLHRLYALRPQTLAFSLCDSPVGLLAALLDVIHTREVPQDATGSRSRSPFLSPVELEMHEASTRPPRIPNQTSTYRLSSVEEEDEQVPIDSTAPPTIAGTGSEGEKSRYTWTPTTMLNFVMLQWLPGPEAGLRWLRTAHLDNAALASKQSSVPLGISTFYAGSNAAGADSTIGQHHKQRREAGTATPLMWGSASWNIAWVKRHQRPATWPGLEAPDLLVVDLREWFGGLARDQEEYGVPEVT